jgi:hypothetical protein
MQEEASHHAATRIAEVEGIGYIAGIDGIAGHLFNERARG